MVTRETNYIGQLYFGLSTDDPADVAEWHNGDRILLLDVNKMYVYDEAAVTFHEIPMGGGGGGGGSGPFMYGTAIAVNNAVTIADGHYLHGYDNLLIYPTNPDDTLYSVAGRFYAFYSAAWYYSYGGYALRSTTTNWKPTNLGITSRTYESLDHDTGTVTYQFNNSNTMGLLPDGTEVTYLWWGDLT